MLAKEALNHQFLSQISHLARAAAGVTGGTLGRLAVGGSQLAQHGHHNRPRYSSGLRLHLVAILFPEIIPSFFRGRWQGRALIKDHLRGIVRARRLSQVAVKNILQNLFFACIYNATAIPMVARVLSPFLGLPLSLSIAAAAMSPSAVQAE